MIMMKNDDQDELKFLLFSPSTSDSILSQAWKSVTRYSQEGQATPTWICSFMMACDKNKKKEKDFNKNELPIDVDAHTRARAVQILRKKFVWEDSSSFNWTARARLMLLQNSNRKAFLRTWKHREASLHQQPELCKVLYMFPCFTSSRCCVLLRLDQTFQIYFEDKQNFPPARPPSSLVNVLWTQLDTRSQCGTIFCHAETHNSC